MFDAKNFSTTETSDAKMKMLSYMNNFNCDFGVLFFPFVPEFWEEWTTKQRRKALFPYYTKLHPEKISRRSRIYEHA